MTQNQALYNILLKLRFQRQTSICQEEKQEVDILGRRRAWVASSGGRRDVAQLQKHSEPSISGQITKWVCQWWGSTGSQGQNHETFYIVQRQWAFYSVRLADGEPLNNFVERSDVIWFVFYKCHWGSNLGKSGWGTESGDVESGINGEKFSK